MPDVEKIASIDIGSNTVLLLIAEVNLSTRRIKTLANFYEMPRISKNLKKTGFITTGRKEKLFEVLEKYKQIIDANRCDKILVSATNAFRIAKNAEEISDEIDKIFGFQVKILSGEEEAKLSFLGATYDLNFDNEALVVDIGGGSTEIIFGSKTNIRFNHSFGFGVVSLTETFITNYPVNESEISELKTFVKSNFNEYKKYIPESPLAVAVAGTPTTLSCINQNLQTYDEEKIENSVLSMNNLRIIISKLESMTPGEIKNVYGQVVSGREDVLLSGALILTVLADVLKIGKYYVSGKGIRYGAVVDYLHNFTNSQNSS